MVAFLLQARTFHPVRRTGLAAIDPSLLIYEFESGRSEAFTKVSGIDSDFCRAMDTVPIRRRQGEQLHLWLSLQRVITHC